MSSNKLILDQNTSINEVADYFKGLDPSKHVRSRKRGDGQIELYVRKDSFKQFFTDKLRAGFLVKRDYKEAKNRILEIVNRADPSGKNLSGITKIKESFAAHKHDFYGDKVNHEFENLSRYLKKQTEAKEILDSIKSSEKIPKDDGNFEDLQRFKDNVKNSQEFLKLNLNHDLIDSQSEHLFNFLQQKYALRKEKLSENDIGNNGAPVFIDYKAIKDFALAWQEAITRSNKCQKHEIKASDQTEKPAFNDDYLTNLSKEIFLADVLQKMDTRRLHNVPIQIDLMPQDIQNTDAACVIIDPDTTPFIHTQLGILPVDFTSEVIFLGDTSISITIKDKTSLVGNENLFDLLKIDYPNERIIDGNNLDDLYEMIFRETLKRMPSHLKDPPNAPDATQLADMPIAMHIPILLMSDNAEENQRRKDEILTSFVKATKKLTQEQPYLRIKVQLPTGISTEDVYAAYTRIQ